VNLIKNDSPLKGTDIYWQLYAGSDPNARDKDGWTPLHWAAGFSKTPVVVKALLDAGSDPNARNKDGQTPLHLAASEGDSPEVVKALLYAGALILKLEIKTDRRPCTGLQGSARHLLW